MRSRDAGAVETVMFRDGNLTEAASNVLSDPRRYRSAKGQLDPAWHHLWGRLRIRARGGIAVRDPFGVEAEVLVAERCGSSSDEGSDRGDDDADGRLFASGTPGPVFRKMHALFQAHKPH